MLPAIKERTITHQKSGSFPPPELPGLTGHTTLSNSRPIHRQERCWSRDLRSGRVSPGYPCHPSIVPCPLPRRDQTGAYVDCFPVRAAFPALLVGSAKTRREAFRSNH
jgi:hypothetical protein